MKNNEVKVLFFLDYGSEETDALTAVAAIADNNVTEVQGLFIEDDDMLAAADLPCFVEVSAHSQSAASISHKNLKQAAAIDAHNKRILYPGTAKLTDIVSNINNAGTAKQTNIVARNRKTNEYCIQCK